MRIGSFMSFFRGEYRQVFASFIGAMFLCAAILSIYFLERKKIT